MQLVIFPVIGVVLTNFFGLNILYSYVINRTKLVQEYNEILFTIIFFNCINWIIYSIVIKDIFLYTCNISSIISSFGFIQLLYKYIDISKLIYIELISCLFIIYLLIIIFLLNFTYNISENVFINITGNCAMFSSLSTYFSPLLIIKKVINTKDPSLIYLPQAIIGTVNLSCWLVYGILINDIYQIITNSLGLCMCLFQVFIYLLFSI
jgi:uncharacterized protein with PQ loop repeat